MKNSMKIFGLTFGLIQLLTSISFAQKGRGNRKGQPHNGINHQAKMNHNNKVVGRRSVY